MYSGNIGLAHSFDEFLEAARRLSGRRDIVFLFVGGGPRLSEVIAAREAHGLKNLLVHDYVPRNELNASLSLADAHLISLRPGMAGIVVPGKLYGAMAAGRPAIFVGPEHCETADAIRHAGCGYTITSGDSDALVAAIERLAADPSLARRMGERARSAFLAAYDERLCCHHWSELLAGLHDPLTHERQTTAPSQGMRSGRTAEKLRSTRPARALASAPTRPSTTPFVTTL
jgi:glycosyltransferase involved in cell wall biosynthesis